MLQSPLTITGEPANLSISLTFGTASFQVRHAFTHDVQLPPVENGEKNNASV
jgi:hypothetical protein